MLSNREVINISDDDGSNSSSTKEEKPQTATTTSEERSIGGELVSIFSNLETVGDFSCGGELAANYVIPGLTIKKDDQFIPISLPICTHEQANTLIQVCRKAPYGLGEQTLYDDQVRNTWQLDPSQFQLTNPKWTQLVQDLVNSKVKKGLGIPPEVDIKASLYKLLFYEKDGHFNFHKDTEKEEGMFATLVIQFPCIYTGGELVVQHNGREQLYDFQTNSQFGAFYASFYADFVPQLQELFTKWNNGEFRESKILYMLEHEYTQAGLSFDVLKGSDEAIVSAITNANRDGQLVGCALGIVKKVESGSASCSGYSYYGGGDFEMDEVYDVTLSLTHCVGMDNKVNTNLRSVGIADKEIFPRDVWKELEADGESVEEATGNEGATMERRYHQAVIILWPEKAAFNMILDMDNREAFHQMLNLIKKWEVEQSTTKEELRPKYISLLNRLIAKKGRDVDMNELFYMIQSLNDVRLVKTSCKMLTHGYRYQQELSKEKILFIMRCCTYFGLEKVKRYVNEMKLPADMESLGGLVHSIKEEGNPAAQYLFDKFMSNRLNYVAEKKTWIKEAQALFHMFLTIDHNKGIEIVAQNVENSYQQNKKQLSDLGSTLLKLGQSFNTKFFENDKLVHLLNMCIDDLKAETSPSVPQASYSLNVKLNCTCTGVLRYNHS
ncbi:hypothetical protein C9374_006270 [Naegleria lovaniensis]|uniref:Prolyl 4-hydroxylase alpha subunit Fe(2+) 2OG dioxygenase domain-containing protein n=1 Tax=Naegleria lovaniensis TaxID=51637 RepID=A0AA88GLG1_NAELO|nr:uncharacterized protein C9374_006270 [Naegleria lovaniensis]KAG2381281.1 hypothetical protein C9374_006270 [Naegleria lovaniensis]